MPNLDVTVDNIRFFVKHNAEGIMTQAGYQSPGAERDEMRSWVIGKIMWDPSRDLQKLVLDFDYGHYGKAAEPIAAYDALLRQAGIDHAAELESPSGGIRYRMDHPFLSEAFLKRADELFAQAEKLADDAVTLHRVERAELPILYVKLSRGPAFVGDAYPDLLTRFERIARAAGATHTWETAPNLDSQIAAWRKAWDERAK
jgi:hypothetical protein